MEELSALIGQHGDDALCPLADWFRSKHLEFTNSQSSFIATFIEQVFLFLSGSYIELSTNKWSQLMLLAQEFALSLTPPLEIILSVELVHTFLPLISSSLLLSQRQQPDKIPIFTYKDLFSTIPKLIEQTAGVCRFYSLTPLYYYSELPAYLSEHMQTLEVQEATHAFFDVLERVPLEQMNVDYIVFAGNIVKSLMLSQPVQPYFDEIFGVLMRATEISPSLFLSRFFVLWYSCNDWTNLREKSVFFLEQVATMTHLMGDTALLKYHDCYRNCRWQLLFAFFNTLILESQKESVLSFIGAAVHRVFQICSLSDFRAVMSTFIDQQVAHYPDDPCSLYYVSFSICSSIALLLFDLGKIMGAARCKENEVERTCFEKVMFSDQGEVNFDLDPELYTSFPLRIFSSVDDFTSALIRCADLAYRLKKRFVSVAWLQFQFIPPVAGVLNNTGNLTLLHHVLATFRDWTVLMITVAHRRYLLGTYDGAWAGRESLPLRETHLLSSAPAILDIAFLFQRFFHLSECYAQQYHRPIARTIATELFKGARREELTLALIPMIVQFPKQLASSVLRAMFQLAVERYDLIHSLSVVDAQLHHIWITFSVSVAVAGMEQGWGPFFAGNLRIYHSLFTAGIIAGIRHIAHQRPALRTVSTYVSALKRYSGLDRPLSHKLLEGLAYDDFDANVKVEALLVLEKLSEVLDHPLKSHTLLPFLEAGLLSQDGTAVACAVRLCLAQDEQQARPWRRALVPALFAAVPNALPETGWKLISLASQFVPAPLPAEVQPTPPPQREIPLPGNGGDMHDVLIALEHGWRDDAQEAAAVFEVVRVCFAAVLEAIDRPKTQYERLLELLVRLLCRCGVCEALGAQVQEYALWLGNAFGDAFTEDRSDAFFVAAVASASAFGSPSAASAIVLADSFCERLRERDVAARGLTKTADHILSFFRPEIRPFAILAGFTLLARHFPGCLQMSHFRGFLVQITDNCPLRPQYSRAMNCLLKLWLAELPPELHTDFAHMVYDIICPLDFGVQIMLFRRLAKLGARLRFQSLTELDGAGPLMVRQYQLAVAILCGVQGRIEVVPGLRVDVVEMLARRDGTLPLAQLTCSLALVFGIFQHRDLVLVFAENGNLPEAFYDVLFNALASPIAPLHSLARKCIKVLKLEYAEDFPVLRPFEMLLRSPGQVFSFFHGPPDTLAFYLRVLKLVPDSVTPASLEPLFHALDSYSQQSKLDRIRNAPWASGIIRAITKEVELMSPETRALVAGTPGTSLGLFLRCVAALVDDVMVPVRKYPARFLALFARETADLLLTVASPPSVLRLIVAQAAADGSGMLRAELGVALGRADNLIAVPLAALELFGRFLVPELAESVVANLLSHGVRGAVPAGLLIIELAMRACGDAGQLLALGAVFMSPLLVHSTAARCVTAAARAATPAVRRDVLALVADGLGPLVPPLIRAAPCEAAGLWQRIAAALPSGRVHAAALHCARALLAGGPPPAAVLAVLVPAAAGAVASGNPDERAQGLKLCTALARRGDLPPALFLVVLRQGLAYEEFAESPLLERFLALLRASAAPLECLAAADAAVVVAFVRGRIGDSRGLLRLVSPTVSVLVAAPALARTLPFSVVAIVAAKATADLAQGNAKQAEDLLLALAGYCRAMRAPRAEANAYARACYRFILVHPRALHILPPREVDTDAFPAELIRPIRSVYNLLSFTIVCFAARVNAALLVATDFRVVEQALAFAAASPALLDTRELDALIRMVLAVPLVPPVMAAAITKTFRVLLNGPSWNRLIVVAGVMLDHRIGDCLPELAHSARSDPSVAEFLIRGAEHCEGSRQAPHIRQCLEIAPNGAARALPAVLASPRVTPPAKAVFIERVPPLLLTDDGVDLNAVIAALTGANYGVNTAPALVAAWLARAAHERGRDRIPCLEAAIAALPTDLGERTLFVFQQIPLEAWQDRFLPFLAAVIAPFTDLSAQFAILADSLIGAGSSLIAAALAPLLTEDIAFTFGGFLNRLLRLSPPFRHQRALTGILTALYQLGLRVHPFLAQRAIRRTGAAHFLEFFLTPDKDPMQEFLLVPSTGDAIFGACRTVLPAVAAAGTALVALADYEPAAECLAKARASLSAAARGITERMHASETAIAFSRRDQLGKMLISAATGMRDGCMPAHFLKEIYERRFIAARARSPLTPFEKELCTVVELASQVIGGIDRATAQNRALFDEQELYTVVERASQAIGGSDRTAVQAALNPGLFAALENLGVAAASAPALRACQTDSSTSVVFLAPHMRDHLRDIVGLTSRGIVIARRWQIKKIVHMGSRGDGSGLKTAAGHRALGTLAFALFSMPPGSEFFDIAIRSYGRVLLLREDTPLHVLGEAAARLCTLIRLGIAHNFPEVQALVERCSDFFDCSLSDIWSFWLQGIVHLASIPWLRDIVLPLLQKWAYRSFHYAQKLHLEELMNNLLANETKQFRMMEPYDQFVRTLFGINFTEKAEQDALMAFARVARHRVEDIDLTELRKCPPTNRFERKLAMLTHRQVDAIGNYRAFAEAAADDAVIDKTVQGIAGATHSLAEIDSELDTAVNLINQNVLFISPFLVEGSNHLTVWHLRNRIRMLSPHMVLIYMTTGGNEWRNYVVQRARGSNGFHRSVSTLSSIWCFMRTMINRLYCAQSRGIVLFPAHFLEIGDDAIIAAVNSGVHSLESLFTRTVGMTAKEWGDTFLESQSSSLRNGQRCVTSDGRASIATFPTDALLHYLVEGMGVQGYLVVHDRFARSVGVFCALRYLFNASYPVLCEWLISKDRIPILHSAFDDERLTSIERSNAASFRMSPNVLTALGMALAGNCNLTIAVIAKTLVINLEGIRSYLEEMILDEDVEAKRNTKTPEELCSHREAFEKRVIDLAPPVLPSGPDVGEEWITQIERILAQAADPEVQPPEAIPWF
jgi:hypothetical protein